MSQNTPDKIEKLTKQRLDVFGNPELSSAPEFESIEFDLPYRFFAYANPELLKPLFQSIFQKLEKCKKTIEHQDAWRFDTVVQTLVPNSDKLDTKSALTKIIRQYKIPEGHFQLKKEPVPGQLFPNDYIYLSRYALYLVTKELLHKSESFRDDISVSNKIDADKSKKNFESEVAIAFARYYFAFPKTDIDELIDITWAWIRGDKLKSKFETVKTKLDNIVKGLKGRNADYRDAHAFRDKFIFDTLFANVKIYNDDYKSVFGFQRAYEQALRQIGYKFFENKWICGNKIAPKVPGSFIAPHIMFVLIKYMNEFCELVYDQQNQEKLKSWVHEHIGRGNENKYTISTPESMKSHCSRPAECMNFNDLELLALEYFLTIRIGLDKLKLQTRGTDFDFSNVQMFCEKSHCDNYKAIKIIEFGRGPKSVDRKTGRKIHADPGVLDSFISVDLFGSDEKACLNYRRGREDKLAVLMEQHKANPTNETMAEIRKLEQEIKQENMVIYGFDIGLFNYPRPPVKLKEVPDKKEQNNKFAQTVQYEIKPIKQIQASSEIINLDNVPMADFQICPETKLTDVKFGHSVSVVQYNDKNGKPRDDWRLDKDGIFQTINSLVEKPTIFRPNGMISLCNDNFQMKNIVFESDTMSLAEQTVLAKKLVYLGMVNRVVFSGNKSVHMNITVGDTPNNPGEYRWLFQYIGRKLGLVTRTFDSQQLRYIYKGTIDLKLSHPAAKTRTPGAFRNIENKKIEQKLLHMTNVIYHIDWREKYNLEIEEIAKMKSRKAMTVVYKTNEVSDNILRDRRLRVSELLRAGWHDGNRNNMLFNEDGNGGIVNLMFNAGYKESEILDTLSIDANRNLINQIHNCIKRSVAR